MASASMHSIGLQCLLLVLLRFSVVAAEIGGKDSVTVQGNNVLEWLQRAYKEQAIVSPKIGVNEATQTLLALQNISKGERILLVPEAAILTPTEEYDVTLCETALRVVDDHSENTSEFATFITYLFQPPPKDGNRKDKVWSKEAKNGLVRLLGGELDPPNPGAVKVETCIKETGAEINPDEMEWDLFQQAISLVQQRGRNDVLIPGYDMVQHCQSPNVIEKFKFRSNEEDDGEETLQEYTIIAAREIGKGEPLLISRRSTPQIFFQKGEVEPYPRRWSFETYEPEIQFNLKKTDGRLEVKWISGAPTLKNLNWLVAHQKRFRTVNADAAVSLIQSDEERELVLEYYHALVEAVDEAVLWAFGDPDQDARLVQNDCALSAATQAGVSTVDVRGESAGDIVAVGSNIQYDAASEQIDDKSFVGCQSNHVDLSRRYDNLQHKPDTMNYYRDGTLSWNCNHRLEFHGFHYEESKSMYQKMEWLHFRNKRSDKDETCLIMDGITHSCTAYRAQATETIVHYPASFLSSVKRVLFVGGGDLIILHEILKYKSVELVVGMELDQTVVRDSFRHYGLQPHFDDERVQWWFGDATKSLAMLPPAYFGTFDLVVIDLLTTVFDSLQVRGLPLVDFLMKLLKPEGIMWRQEDFSDRVIVDFATTVVDLEIHPLPYLCSRSFTMGSNTIDFFSAPRTDHGIANFHYQSFLGEQNHTGTWASYRKNTPKQVPDPLPQKSALGVLTVMEVEDTQIALKHDNIKSALVKVGLEGVSAEFGLHGEIVYLFSEGYLVARPWSEHRYCAFDLQLWNNSIEKQGTVVAALLDAVGGSQQSMSSYKIATGGVLGVGNDHGDDGAAEKLATETSVSDESPKASRSALTNETFDLVLQMMSSLPQTANGSTIFVVCPEQLRPCESLEMAKNRTTHSIETVWACPDASFGMMANSTLDDEGSKLHNINMLKCEQQTKLRLLDIASAKGERISSVVLDPAVPKEMGQVLHRVLSNRRNRGIILADAFVILAPSPTESQWRSALLERLRTEVVQFSPLYHTLVSIGSFEVDILSAGDAGFYLNLRAAPQIEIADSKVGLMSHVPDFEPAFIVSDNDYHSTAARDQWLGQHPLGHQTIMQFELRPKRSIPIGARVWVNTNVHPVKADWFPAHVTGVNDTDGTYTVAFDSADAGHPTSGIQRSMLVEANGFATKLPIDFGEHVLARAQQEQNGVWFQAVFVGTNADGDCRIESNDSRGLGVSWVKRSDLIRRATKPDETRREGIISPKQFREILSEVHHHLDPDADSRNRRMVMRETGKGCVVVGFFPGGHFVGTWDGDIHMDVNLFMLETISPETESAVQDIFAHHLPDSVVVQLDTQPRGFGRVVNFQKDLESTWFGNITYNDNQNSFRVNR